MDYEFKTGQLIIYENGENIEIGKIKSLTNTGAFINYHSGETAALTDFRLIKPIINETCITKTNLGGSNNE